MTPRQVGWYCEGHEMNVQGYGPMMSPPVLGMDRSVGHACTFAAPVYVLEAGRSEAVTAAIQRYRSSVENLPDSHESDRRWMLVAMLAALTGMLAMLVMLVLLWLAS